MNKLILTALGSVLLVSNGAYADQVIPDDLIVQSSICAGFDCVNGESFGFDTLRLKENNLRIKFEDTSVGSFPTTDWQLTANDSTAGGASRFSIEDVTGTTIPFTIRGGAPSNSIFVNNIGKVGFRTATPVLDLHINSSDTPAFRMEQNNTGGFTAQTWDIGANEANFFVRDLTSGSRLPFRIRPGAPTSSIDIAASGKVGIGTAGAATNLHIRAPSGQANTLRLETIGTAVPNKWDFTVNDVTGRITLTDDPTAARIPFKFGVGSAHNLLRIGINAPDRIDITGHLFINDTQVGPDYVFTPSYRLMSIDDHMKQMWEQKHLPKLAPAATDEAGHGVIDVGARSHGTLEELEIAHIYIQQLHERIKALEERLAKLEAH